jgi:Rieske Fe-S protein
MNRKEFIKNSAVCCAGIMVGSVLISSCSAVKMVNLTLENDSIKVPLTIFENNKGDKIKFHRNIIVKADQLEYPLVIYRYNENDFNAFKLECTHQGTELNVNGDMITCSGHGSEFNNKGEVIEGPAKSSLQNYAIKKEENELIISIV